MALLGFLLPWSRVVIGASTIGGYFDGWGLASPTHLLVFVGLLGVLALALRRGPLSPWISSGILGLVFGGLLFGLAWPYLVGPLGADVGLTLTALGAVALLIGGVVTLVGDPSRGGRTGRLKRTAAERRLRSAPCYTAPDDRQTEPGPPSSIG